MTGLSGPRFSEPRFPGEYPPQDGPLSDYPGGDYGEPDYGGFDYLSRQDSLDSGMDRRPYQGGIGGDFGSGGGRSGLLDDDQGRMHPDEYRGSQMGNSLMGRPMDKPLERPGLMGAAPESSNLSNTLLTYLVRISFLTIISSLTLKVSFILFNYSYLSFTKMIF